MGAFAADHMARLEPKKAIPLLEQALERQLQREDLARKLRAAYMETGQHARARRTSEGPCPRRLRYRPPGPKPSTLTTE
jgi:hypothetical protein